MAKAVGRSMPVSTKQAIEICNTIRKMPLAKAKRLLDEVSRKKIAIKFRRFTEGAGHKPGIGAGKYPVKASKEMLALLESAEANAQFKGLNTGSLVIKHISAQDGGNVWRYGRRRRRRMKRTHIEIVLEESKKEEKKTKATAAKVPATPKAKASEAPKAKEEKKAKDPEAKK